MEQAGSKLSFLQHCNGWYNRQAISESETTLRIGVISDTHGVFDSSINELFRGVDSIIHAGDIGKLEIIHQLERIAPVLAVEGNNDWFNRFPSERIEDLAGHRVLVRHIFGELHQLREPERRIVDELQPSLVVFGHSHRPYAQMLGKTLLFNPGSAGPRRFSLPRTVGVLVLRGSKIETEIINL